MRVREYLLMGRSMCAYLPVGGDGLSFFNNSNITGDEFASLDLLLLSPANNLCATEVVGNPGCKVREAAYRGFHSNPCLKLFDDIPSLFLLIPTDESIKHKNSDLPSCVRQDNGGMRSGHTITPKSIQSLRPAERSTASSMTVGMM